MTHFSVVQTLQLRLSATSLSASVGPPLLPSGCRLCRSRVLRRRRPVQQHRVTVQPPSSRAAFHQRFCLSSSSPVFIQPPNFTFMSRLPVQDAPTFFLAPPPWCPIVEYLLSIRSIPTVQIRISSPEIFALCHPDDSLAWSDCGAFWLRLLVLSLAGERRRLQHPCGRDLHLPPGVSARPFEMTGAVISRRRDGKSPVFPSTFLAP